MKYAVIDMIKGGDLFEEIYDTFEKAKSKYEAEWEHLSNYDKKRREYFALGSCELDENGCIDYNNFIEISFK